jgi:hypothetical protein
MVNAQMTPDAPQVHAIHVHSDGLLSDFIRVAMLFWLRRVFAATMHAPVSLRARNGLSSSVLAGDLFTTRTGVHIPILTHIFSHSHKRGGSWLY